MLIQLFLYLILYSIFFLLLHRTIKARDKKHREFANHKYLSGETLFMKLLISHLPPRIMHGMILEKTLFFLMFNDVVVSSLIKHLKETSNPETMCYVYARRRMRNLGLD